MKETLLISILVAVFSTLLTYVITTIVNNKSFIKVLTDSFKQHEAVWHQQTMEKYVKDAVNEHKTSCDGFTKMSHIEKIVLAIYAKQGGKIEDLKI